MAHIPQLASLLLDQFMDDREEAIAANNSLGAIRLPLKALSIRLAMYILAIFTVVEIAFHSEVAATFVLLLIACAVCSHSGVPTLFAITVALVFPIAEMVVTNSPSRAWRYQITSGSTVLARTTGIPMWLPVLWASASVAITDLHRVCARGYFMLGVKLPPK